MSLDLRVAPGPGLPHGLLVPAAELEERFSRSSGPGGQSVNTTDSRVELEWDVAASAALTDAQRARLLAHLGPRLTGTRVVVVAAEHRSQHRNRVTARERLSDVVRRGLAPPSPPRRATRPTRGSQLRRLDAKRRRADVKTLRGRVDPGR